MIEKIIKALFGDPSEKTVKEITKYVEQIKEFEKNQENFSEEDIINKTKEFQALFEELDFHKEADSLEIKETLENIKLEAFALVKTACKLINGKTFDLASGKSITWNMIPYDVQLVWGLAIHEGNISEMKTWEWKTLVATLPAYLNALTGNPVHIVTVNDYLASRDAEEMGVLYKTLGLSVWVVNNGQDNLSKKEAYTSDIVYATNNELGFDYLRDNMVIKKENKAQSKLFFAIIDEVDSILVDEARTPLIISQPDNEPTSKYGKFATLAKELKKGIHYKIDEKQKTATLNEEGIQHIEKLLHIDNIYVSNHYNDLHHIENAIKASGVYIKDKDYLVNNWEVLIIDEHTGRVLAGRRYSEWLHQAIEAKEGVKIQQESKTLASITFQNYFRMYWKLSGMTGTAKTEEEEFYKVYGLETLVIPTNKPLIRDDRSDLLFKNEKGKFEYVVELIRELNKTGQPILVGTVSVEKSEYLSSILKTESIPHKVLNAKHHEHEAEIVANAWQKWAITIATNMAWRGTDIKLGEWVQDLGWLIILGTEKHETRRIDNQLRGRSGRQWDPGMTQFLISPNDDIMRIFGWDKLFSVFNSPVFASLPDNEPLSQSGMLTRKVTWVQKQVEWHNFDIRKHILEYDDVINKHRGIIYWKRNTVLDTEENSEIIDNDVKNMIRSQITQITTAELTKWWENFKKEELIKKINEFLWVNAINDTIEIDDVTGIQDAEKLSKYIGDIAVEELDKIKNSAANIEEFYNLERRIILSSIDELWMRHIDAMSRLREEVAFEWYAQRSPLVVYKEKAFEKFSKLINELEYKVVKAIFSVTQITQVEQVDLSASDMQLNEVNIQDVTKIKGPKPTPAPKNSNPLFMNPGSAPKSNSKWGERKKIRV
jgi:preprotein translocase subunit SecA